MTNAEKLQDLARWHAAEAGENHRKIQVARSTWTKKEYEELYDFHTRAFEFLTKLIAEEVEREKRFAYNRKGERVQVVVPKDRTWRVQFGNGTSWTVEGASADEAAKKIITTLDLPENISWEATEAEISPASFQGVPW